MTHNTVKHIYSLMFPFKMVMEVKDIIRDIYPDLCSKELSKSEIAELEIINNFLKKFSTINIEIIIPEIAFIYILALAYNKLDLLDSIAPSDDLYAELDYIFPYSYNYHLPSVVGFYHTYKDKKTFNSIRFSTAGV